MAKKIVKKSPLKIEHVQIDDIQPHPRNPRLHNEENLNAIAASLKEFGQRTPIVVWSKRNLVIKGCGTWQAAKDVLGWRKIDIVRADSLTEKQALAYAIADNKTTDMSEFDYDMVSEIVGDIAKSDVNIESLGFSTLELDVLLEVDSPVDSPDEFASYDDGIEVEHRCPKCGYEWSGGQ